MSASEKSRRNARTSEAMKRSARQRSCPSCGRGGAVIRKVTPDEVVVRSCRWCPWTDEHPLAAPADVQPVPGEPAS